MGVKQPKEISEAFGRLFNGRDKGALLDLYAADAILTIDGAVTARGKAEIDKTISTFLDGPLMIAIKCASCHQAGDIAIVRSDWKLTAPDGSVAMAGSSAEVLRRDSDGQWRFAIDDATFASRPSSL
jgi:uncharacterized protein (TIGR02246 family)